jgi:hypothetical protein
VREHRQPPLLFLRPSPPSRQCILSRIYNPPELDLEASFKQDLDWRPHQADIMAVSLPTRGLAIALSPKRLSGIS